MWTPKRIILLAGGFAAFTLVYVLYTLTAVGRINTLPPLPEQYLPCEGDGATCVRPRRTIKTTPLQRKLEMAFYPGCEELKWPVQLELNAKSMVVAAWKFEIADRGRVKLELMSLALFGKKKNENDSREIEINTLKCKQAYITFDRPVSSFSPGEMSGRKVVEAELFGDSTRPILITNNRRTAAREDDLVVTITNGPLYYFEKTQIVKTSDHVHLQDGMPTFRNGRPIPPKADIRAQGLEMELETSTTPPRPGFFPHKPKNQSITGVKRIILKEAVTMNLYVARGGPFPNNDKASGAASASREKHAEKNSGRLRGPPRQDAAEPARIRIDTPGRFEYFILKDHDLARFEVPVNTNLPSSPQDVTVMRINDQTGNNDMLVCKYLELRLRRRTSDAPAGRDTVSTEQGIEIETAHATGPDVTLTSDAEKLDAHGNDFFHDTAKKLTILKGNPYMEAHKEDSLIRAPELRIQDIPLPVGETVASPAAGSKPPAKTYQQIQASGPGSIHMTNKSTGKQNTHAYWNDQLLSTRDGTMDLLILTGSARFVDDEHQQSLQAETLKVWLLAEDKKLQATDKKPQAPAQASAVPGPSRRPHRVEALRNVLAHSPELNIHDAARLVIHFRDVPPARMPPPSSANNKPGGERPLPKQANGGRQPSVGNGKPDGSGKQRADAPRSLGSGKQTADAPRSPVPLAAPASGPLPLRPNGLSIANDQKSPTETSRPIDLSARSIEAKVLRSGERMALDHLWAEGGALDAIDKRGGVVVRQEPAKPGEEGVYIEGNTLDMSSSAGGNVLVVTGDLAQLKMDKIFILGPEVNVDQVANKAWVIGGGAMQMQSTTTLEGKPLAHPVPLTVHWSDNMLFCGTFADFFGNIQAEQNNSRLACQHLQVIFDKPISLKEGMRGTQPAKVSHLVGDKGTSGQDIRVEDQTFEGGKLQKYQLLIGRAIAMNTVPRDEDDPQDAGRTGPRSKGKNNDANEVTLSGPGSVRILQRGGTEVIATPGKAAPSQPAPGKNAAQDQEMKMTYIQFEKLMQASTLTNVANFWEAVRVLNFPCDNPHCDIDLDAILSKELPDGALYLRCKQLRVGTYQKAVAAGTGPKQLRTYQVMEARGEVFVQGREFTAQCNRMTFNEEKDQVIFIGEGDNLAVMSKCDVKGQSPEVMRAKKFTYIRSTGAIYASEIGSIDGQQ